MRILAAARRPAVVACLCCAALASAAAAPAAAPPAPASPTADPVFSHPVSADSRPAMAESFGRLSEKAVVSGSFVQAKRIRRLGRDLVSKGEFLFSAKDGVYWKLTSPYPSTIVMTSTRLVQVSESGEASVIDSKDNAVFKRIAGTMQAVFSGSLGALEADFKVYFQGDESIRKLTLAEGSGDFIVYSFATTRRTDDLEETERGLFVF
jgi:outer membrane lipoprotein-sorting protein